MQPSQRAQYLEALGIDVWVPRGTAPAAARATRTPAPEGAREGAREREGQRAAEQAPAGEAADAWAALRAEVAPCRRCGLHAGRTQTVFGVGNPRADWFVIGEAPGAEEDRQGEPFVGRAGQLLNAMLRAIGLPRESVWIANILKCRPPGNRDPKPEEVAACLPYLLRQIALVQPRMLLAVGRVAAQSLLGTDAPLARLRGRLHHYGPAGTPLVVTYHPAYLLRSPGEKRKAWEDLKFARATLQGIVGVHAPDAGVPDGHGA